MYCKMTDEEGLVIIMKRKIALLTTMSIIMNLFTPQPVGADFFTGDLQRLHWLCSDYQLPIKGYVIEGWFSLYNWPGLQNTIEQQLQLESGQHQGLLLDGSTLNTSVQRRGHKFYIELQLVTEHFETAQHYYALWQSFADGYKTTKPVGITIIAEFPELLEERAKEQLASELLQSLCVEPQMGQVLNQSQQFAVYSPQLRHSLEIGGQYINCNVAFTQREDKTIIYVATPVIYQQY